MPSHLPVKPRLSSVVALIFTRSSGIPNTAACNDGRVDIADGISVFAEQLCRFSGEDHA